jgi:hypothetical protein
MKGPFLDSITLVDDCAIDAKRPATGEDAILVRGVFFFNYARRGGKLCEHPGVSLWALGGTWCPGKTVGEFRNMVTESRQSAGCVRVVAPSCRPCFVTVLSDFARIALRFSFMPPSNRWLGV